MSTTNFQHAPQEILLKIFKLLYSKSLKQCQHVCRSWYLPAHLLLLTDINLTTTFAAQQFLQSIKANSNSIYLKAVKKISIGDKNDRNLQTNITKKELEQLFCQFPYLERITINNQLQSFNNEKVCKSICSQVETIAISIYSGCLCSRENVQNYEKFTYKLRQKLTNLIVPPGKLDNRSESKILDYLAAFCQLQELEVPESFASKDTNLTNILKLFETIPHLKVLQCKMKLIETDAVDKHLRMKDEEERTVLLERLSKLKYFSLQNTGTHLYSNMIHFITQYLSGLDSLVLCSKQNHHWTDIQKNEFFRLLDYAYHLYHFDISIQNPPESTILDCLQLIPSKHALKALHISFNYKENPFSFKITWNKNTNDHFVQIWCLYSLNLDQICDKLLGTTPLKNDIDTLKLDTTVLSFCELDQFPIVFFSALEAILDNLPLVKKLVLTTPMASDYEEFKVPKAYPQIQHLEVNVALNINERKTIDTIITMFPDVTYLKMHYFCGIYIVKKRQIQMLLKQHELERLDLDISFAYMYTQCATRLQSDFTTSFFVLEVYLLEKRKRYLFKVSLDYFVITPIEKSDLVRGRQNMFLKVVAKDLKLLCLYLYHDIPLFEVCDKLYFEENPQDIKEIKVRLN